MSRSLECPECGAPTPPDVRQCSYCGAYLMGQREDATRQPAVADEAPDERRLWPGLAPGEGEFGLPGHTPILMGLIVASGLYLLGWLMEDLRYWLDGRAVVVWVGLLPGWLLLVSLGWRAERRGWLPGLVLTVLLFVSHLGAMWAIAGRLNDDYVGISAAFAAAAGAGWAVGRLLHSWLRLRRVGEQGSPTDPTGR